MQLHHHCSDLTDRFPTLDATNTSALYLDIETTGLSADVSAIFMIGCGFIENGVFRCIQWLADGPTVTHEQEILLAFSNFGASFFSKSDEPEIITYNGHVFDLPFLKSRFEACKVTVPDFLTQHHSIDVYRKFGTLKHLLPVKNLKLKTLSEWLGYTHSKAPAGKQLIKTYQNYIKIKDSELLNLLFLHNIEDLEALFFIQSIYAYFDVFSGDYEIVSVIYHEDTGFEFELCPTRPLPAAFTYHTRDYTLHFDTEKIRLQAVSYPQGVRYYYTNFKDYVYLPKEDYALHKSMASYINKSHYVKATQETCYTWFVPDATFLDNRKKIHDYIQMIFQSLRLF